MKDFFGMILEIKSVVGFFWDLKKIFVTEIFHSKNTYKMDSVCFKNSYALCENFAQERAKHESSFFATDENFSRLLLPKN